MKKILKKSIIFMMVAFCYQVANAQNVVDSISTNDFAACKEYLAEHPLDTIVNGAVRVFVAGGKIVRTGSMVVSVVPSTKAFNSEAVDVEKEGDNTIVYYGDGTTTTFTPVKTGQLTMADQLDILSGKKKAIKLGHKDWDNQLRHKLYGCLSAGTSYMPKAHCWQPMLVIELGHESCHWLVAVQGELTWARYTQTADYSGSSYLTGALYILGGLKVWQNALNNSFVAVFLAGGYAYQETDPDNAKRSSKNWGFGAKGGARAKIMLVKKVGLTAEFGALLQPWVEHTNGFKDQKLDNIGVYTLVGVQYTF